MAEYPLILSVPTSLGGASAAATYSFLTSGYMPPRQPRDASFDSVHNQNGIFNYDYDNGPGPYQWNPFVVMMVDDFVSSGYGSATQQWANFLHLWNYIEGPLGMEAPDGVYSVKWAEGMQLERQFLSRHGAAGDKARREYRTTIQLREA